MFEISLVPDVKAEMLKVQKTRNFVYAICVIVSAISIGLVLLLIVVKGGLDFRISAQDHSLELMSKKLESFDSLSELLTVQKQLTDLGQIQTNKKNLSRMFTVLGTLFATNADDVIRVSSLSVNLEDSTITFDGQADAGTSTDGIDYRVLEEFTKKVVAMNYDYGNYVDTEGRVIPAYCIEDTDGEGSPYVDPNGNYYAYWLRGNKGCDPGRDDFAEEEEEVEYDDEDEDGSTQNQNSGNSSTGAVASTEMIYRTPQFTEWYGSRDGNSNRLMDTDGTIQGVSHFESQCAKYQGVTNSQGNVVWQTTYSDECMLAPDGVVVSSSSDGRGAGGTLVLRFSASIAFSPEVFDFNNKHVLAIAPKGRTNVTDSFVQVGEMFTDKAADVESESSR